MADDRKSTAEHNARRVAERLAASATEFEQHGVAENELALAVGLTERDLAEAVDYLENREEVVRFPHSVLKPGRGWPEMRASIDGRGLDSGARPSDPDMRA
jgi:hypothetical protein